MKGDRVFEPVPIDEVPKGSTWAKKQKANGIFHARINARGYEQKDGKLDLRKLSTFKEVQVAVTTENFTQQEKQFLALHSFKD